MSGRRVILGKPVHEYTGRFFFVELISVEFLRFKPLIKIFTNSPAIMERETVMFAVLTLEKFP